MADETRAAGGVCAPIDNAYALPSNNERPIRDALVRWMELSIKRMRLPADERIAFDIENYGYSVEGRTDAVTEICETRPHDDWDEGNEGVTGHRWDRCFVMGGK